MVTTLAQCAGVHDSAICSGGQLLRFIVKESVFCLSYDEWKTVLIDSMLPTVRNES